jgi:putative Mn2+ efflux pump MntP
MSWAGLFAVSVALALDAFAVAVVAGLTLNVLTTRRVFRLSFHFGFFQAGMLTAGWLVGAALHNLVAAAATWIAFGLLMLVGANTIQHGIHGDGELHRVPDPTTGWQLVLLSLATSIDALGVGLSLAMIGTSIAVSACAVGLMATLLTLVGMKLGRRVSTFWGQRVEILGGLMLMAIGCKSLWDYLK